MAASEEINFANAVFYTPLDDPDSFRVQTIQNSNASSIALVHKATPIMLNQGPEEPAVKRDVRYRSFWLGQDEWLPDEAKITIKNNGGILVTADEKQSEGLGISFITTVVTGHEQFIETFGKARISSALRMGKRPRVFIVYGHDETTLQAVMATLSLIGADPVPFGRLPTGGSQTIVEILEKGIREVDAIVCLFTPDDEGRKKGSDGPLEPRARENVLIEAGYAVLQNRQTSLIVAIGEVSIPSDFGGIFLVLAPSWNYDAAMQVAARLAQMGLNVDDSRVPKIA